MKKLKIIAVILSLIMAITALTSCNVKKPEKEKEEEKTYEDFLSKETYENAEIGFSVSLPEFAVTESYKKKPQANLDYVASTGLNTTVFAIISYSDKDTDEKGKNICNLSKVKSQDDAFSALEQKVINVLTECNSNPLLPLKYESTDVDYEAGVTVKNIPSVKFSGKVNFTRGENIKPSIDIAGYALYVNEKPVIIMCADCTNSEVLMQKMIYEIECMMNTVKLVGDKDA